MFLMIVILYDDISKDNLKLVDFESKLNLLQSHI